ncbi:MULTISPECIES: hypothetical protein [Gordonia]|uniref:hypothetical protein n=1 Tax=Gordonia TaxID=2053 RepID=UPI00071DBD25|nr:MULTISPECIES: hypothetical protein [unclassified Gordonia (in: high G+C Gram-positive bacteria)]KSU59508.1 hypothetical protein AS181_05500 [Gordonia sp. SGD-V-85]MCX2752720.1 hypothetical protein [Gordonia sp. 4N]SCB98503.1 hypothetical protein GA0061091_1044 [Gordonia sp. v-85]
MTNSKARAHSDDSVEAATFAGIVRKIGEMRRADTAADRLRSDSRSALTGVDSEGPAEAERGVA